MKTVITYGTFDLFHEGHVNILKRAKALGDYLIVGVTSDYFDFRRGKINVKQSTVERIKNIEFSGFADKVIVEEKEGQKIDDIIKYKVDIIVLGSDWYGKIDYLKKYCDVVYLPRTVGISSTLLRSHNKFLKVGLVGNPISITSNFDEINLVGTNEIKWISSKDCDNVKQFATTHDTAFFENLHNDLPPVDMVVMFNDTNLFEGIKFFAQRTSVYVGEIINLTVDQIIELKSIANNNLLLSITPSCLYNTMLMRIFNVIQTNQIGEVFEVDIKIKNDKLSDYYIKTLFFFVNRFIKRFDSHKFEVDKYKTSSHFRIILKSKDLFVIIRSYPLNVKNSILISGTTGQLVINEKLEKISQFKVVSKTGSKKEFGPDFIYSPRFAYLSFIQSLLGEQDNMNLDFYKFIINHKELSDE